MSKEMNEGWISVNVSLPDKDQLVIVDTRYCKVHAAVAYRVGDKWIERIFDFDTKKTFTSEIMNVTHWMPLPKPPML